MAHPNVVLFDVRVGTLNSTEITVILKKRRPSQSEGLPTKDPLNPPPHRGRE